MFSKVLSAFGGAKLKEAKTTVLGALAAADPSAMSAAQMAIYEEQLDTLALQTAQIRQMAVKETREADEAKGTYNRYLGAAQGIQAQLDDESVTGKKRKDLETSLAQLMERLEELRPEVEREVAEANDANEELAEMETFLKESADRLKNAKKTLEGAERNMRTAKRDEERASAKEARAKQRAGIGGSDDSMDAALNAMNGVAEQARASADAKSSKAELLAPVLLKDDANIAAALDAFDGVDNSKSDTEKLGALEAF